MKNWFHIVITIFSLLVFISCENDLNAIKKVSFKPTDPDERTANVHMIQTDSGFAKIEIKAMLSETYYKPKTIIKFRKGIEITLYNQQGKVESVLSSLYGEIVQETGQMLFKDSVRLKNIKENQILETEELLWNQNTQAVFTDKSVIVKSRDGSLFYGDGIKTSLDFKQYEFVKPKGKFNLN